MGKQSIAEAGSRLTAVGRGAAVVFVVPRARKQDALAGNGMVVRMCHIYAHS